MEADAKVKREHEVSMNKKLQGFEKQHCPEGMFIVHTEENLQHTAAEILEFHNCGQNFDRGSPVQTQKNHKDQFDPSLSYLAYINIAGSKVATNDMWG